MKDLKTLRNEIDEIDRELLPLFLKRTEISRSVAQYKIENNLKVLDREREREILQSKTEGLSSDLKDSVYRFYSSVMAISRSVQSRELSASKGGADILAGFEHKELEKSGAVAYQGVKGAYSEEALTKAFGENAETISLMTFSEVVQSVVSGNAKYGILPIENSTTGSIADVCDLIEKNSLYIVGEVDIPIKHCLMALKGAELSDIKTVYSHEQGIMQCGDFLKKLGDVELKSYFNTALSAKKIAGGTDKTVAAIAGKRAAEIYGLDILCGDIASGEENTTRFAIVSKCGIINESCNKISLAFRLPHESGTLAGVLSALASGGLNLTKIESRPLKGEGFEYMFYADIEGNLLNSQVIGAINQLAGETSYIRLLGNYSVQQAAENL